jgi:hypothetical protein
VYLLNASAADYNTPNYKKRKNRETLDGVQPGFGFDSGRQPSDENKLDLWVLLWSICFGGGLGCVSYFVTPVCNVNVVWTKNSSL